MAHRLSSLHDAADSKVFDKVVVITDRRVLDRQLQDTIYQFEHAHGVVMRIDENCQQLADALAGEQARIIITTLQKFPFVTDKIESLPHRRYAVIVDEAHSSQTGDSAASLKAVLGAGQRAEPGRAGRTRPRTRSPLRRPLGASSRTCRSSPSPPRRRHARWSCSAATTRRPAGTCRSTCTRCARRSRRASSSTCSPTTSPTRRTGTSSRRSPTTPSSTPARPRRRSPSSSPCTRTSWPRRPR